MLTLAEDIVAVEPALELGGHGEIAWSCEISGDESYIVTGGISNCHLWHLPSGKHEYVIAEDSTHMGAISRDGMTVAICSSPWNMWSQCTLIDVTDCESKDVIRYKLRINRADFRYISTWGCAFGSDGRTLFLCYNNVHINTGRACSVGQTGGVLMVDIATGGKSVLLHDETSPHTCDVSDDGSIVALSTETKVLVYDRLQRQTLFKWQHPSSAKGDFWDAKLSADGSVVTFADQSTLRVASVRDPTDVRTIVRSLYVNGRCAISKIGNLVAAQTVQGVGIWDAKSGHQVANLTGAQGKVMHICISRRLQYVAAAIAEKTYVWPLRANLHISVSTPEEGID